MAGAVDLTYSAAVGSRPGGVRHGGRDAGRHPVCLLYDSFTITVLMQLEDLGFCRQGRGRPFRHGWQPDQRGGQAAVHTDGGGLCNNHPANRGGITKVIEAVRQLRGEAHPAVQVPELRPGPGAWHGGLLGSRHGAATLILERV